MPYQILMVIPNKDFRDVEYLKPKEIFEQAGMQVITASVKTGECLGADGAKVQADIGLDKVSADNFQGLVFVGGPGAETLFENKTAWKVARDFTDIGKIVGAICIAPVILAKADVLQGKRATVFESGKDILGTKGAIYVNTEVEADGNIVTAAGPEAVEKFAQLFVTLLKRKF